ncbi:MAG: HIT domain-containing protein [Chlamydiae bacterium]|nr:HIT domain-containing protein [Chlamydiota bacterium]
MAFELHQNFSSKIFLADLPLCRVLLENERHYPWILLIPRRENVSRIMELSSQDQLQLLQELDFAQNILWNEFHPLQLNVAAIGNKTPQLHIHVIARFKDDPSWPKTVWDHPTRENYSTLQLNEIRETLQRCLLKQPWSRNVKGRD